MKKIKAYKGFDKNLQCRGFQFEVGKFYEHEGKIEPCRSGFHACEYPLDVFGFYAPAEANRFAEVELSGEIKKETDKICAAAISIKAEISINVLIHNAVKFIMAGIKQDGEKKSHQTEEKTQATNTGNRSAATNTGYRSAATNTGDWSAATNTGYQSAATNTGNQSAATNTGNQSAATNTGNQSAATNTGYQSAATNTGNQSAATNTGNQSAATNTGYQSAATNTGYQSAATNTGYQSAATNTGDWSAAEVSGKESVAAVFGRDSKARASKGSWIVLTYRNDNGEIKHIKTAQAGVTKSVKADTWYKLTSAGKFEEAQ